MLAGKLLAGGRTNSLGYLSTTMTSGRNTDSSDYDTGFSATGGGAALAPFGSLLSTTIGSDTVKGIFWESGTGYSGSDSPVYVAISGNKPIGSVSVLVVDGAGMGSVASRAYIPGSDITIFTFGSVRANPFGALGSTHSIDLF